MKINKILTVITILCIFLCAFVGCDKKKQEESTGIEVGYFGSDNITSPICIACKSDTNEFDLNEVKLTISYGWYSGFRDEDLGVGESNFKMFVSNMNVKNSTIIIKEILDFNTLNYKCSFKTDDNNQVYMDFSHTEDIIIPKELFVGESGMIKILIDGKFNENYGNGKSIRFNYVKKSEDIVKLSVIGMNVDS